MHEHRRKVPQIIFTRPKSPGLGHLALKSSVFAPTAMSFIGQDYVFNHMKSHYKRISSAKAAVDTTPPRALTSNIKAQDKKRREKLARNSPSSTPRPGTSRSQCSTYSTQEERLIPNDTGFDYSHFARTSTPNTPGRDHRLDEQPHSRQSREPGARDALRISNEKLISNERRQQNQNIDIHREHNPNFRTESSLTTFRHVHRDKPDTRLDLSGLTSRTTGRTPRPVVKESSRKDPHLIMWEKDQKYLRFTQDLTADVLARGIFSDRVLNKVFESHIDKNREELDEERMREMIEQLKIDLGMGDDS